VGPSASTLGLCADGSGKLYLALNVTDPASRLPEYGIVEIGPEGSSPHGWQVPKPIYLPELFRRDDGAVWILGTVESGNREFEVLLPVASDEVPAARRRFAASEETILAARSEMLIRFLRDTWKKAPARIVTDTLGVKGKRTEWKLPKEPYPNAAWMDGEGLIHVLSWAKSESLHAIYTATGEPVAEHAVAFQGLGGQGGYRPILMGPNGADRYVTGQGPAVGVIATCPGTDASFTELLSLPEEQFVFSLWPTVPFAGNGWAARFTFGSLTGGGGGNGWLAVQEDRLVASWLGAEPGVYHDHEGVEHRLDDTQLSLSRLDILPDGRFACCFETQARTQPGRVHVALVAPLRHS
jgi:hypothetical protein